MAELIARIAWRCSECEPEAFPLPTSEGYLPVYLLRDRVEERALAGLTADERLRRIVLQGLPQPEVAVTLDGQPLEVRTIHELQAGEDGWVVLYEPSYDCPRGCGGYWLPIRYGRVEVTVREPVAAS